jgi:hypothetical protein
VLNHFKENISECSKFWNTIWPPHVSNSNIRFSQCICVLQCLCSQCKPIDFMWKYTCFFRFLNNNSFFAIRINSLVPDDNTKQMQFFNLKNWISISSGGGGVQTLGISRILALCSHVVGCSRLAEVSHTLNNWAMHQALALLWRKGFPALSIHP